MNSTCRSPTRDERSRHPDGLDVRNSRARSQFRVQRGERNTAARLAAISRKLGLSCSEFPLKHFQPTKVYDCGPILRCARKGSVCVANRRLVEYHTQRGEDSANSSGMGASCNAVSLSGGAGAEHSGRPARCFCLYGTSRPVRAGVGPGPHRTRRRRNDAAAELGLLETGRGVYDWTTMDQWMDAAISSGKKITLAIRAGANTPCWLFQAPQCGAGYRP